MIMQMIAEEPKPKYIACWKKVSSGRAFTWTITQCVPKVRALFTRESIRHMIRHWFSRIHEIPRKANQLYSPLICVLPSLVFIYAIPFHIGPSYIETQLYHSFNSFPSGQNGRHFADDLFRYIFLNEQFFILIPISLKFVAKCLIDNKWALV